MVALLGAGLLIASPASPPEALQDVEWGTLAFFMGLFIMVGGLVEAGVLAALAAASLDFAGDVPARLHRGAAWGSGLLSGIVDNIPYVAA